MNKLRKNMFFRSTSVDASANVRRLIMFHEVAQLTQLALRCLNLGRTFDTFLERSKGNTILRLTGENSSNSSWNTLKNAVYLSLAQFKPAVKDAQLMLPIETEDSLRACVEKNRRHNVAPQNLVCITRDVGSWFQIEYHTAELNTEVESNLDSPLGSSVHGACHKNVAIMILWRIANREWRIIILWWNRSFFLFLHIM